VGVPLLTGQPLPQRRAWRQIEERRDVPFYGLLVCRGDDARMFVCHHGATIGWLIEFCRDRFGLGYGPLVLRDWAGRTYQPAEGVPPEGTPLWLCTP